MKNTRQEVKTREKKSVTSRVLSARCYVLTGDRVGSGIFSTAD